MKESQHKILSRFFKYNYPVYSGSSIICLECGNEYWLSGQEFKANIDDGLKKIFIHKSDCLTHDKLMKEFNSVVDEMNMNLIPTLFPADRWHHREYSDSHNHDECYYREYYNSHNHIHSYNHNHNLCYEGVNSHNHNHSHSHSYPVKEINLSKILTNFTSAYRKHSFLEDFIEYLDKNLIEYEIKCENRKCTILLSGNGWEYITTNNNGDIIEVKFTEFGQDQVAVTQK